MASKGGGGGGGEPTYNIDEGVDQDTTYLTTGGLKGGDGSTLPFNPEEASDEEWLDVRNELYDEYYDLLENMDNVDYRIEQNDFTDSAFEDFSPTELREAYQRIMDYYQNVPREVHGNYVGDLEEALSGIEKYLDYRQNTMETNYRNRRRTRRRR